MTFYTQAIQPDATYSHEEIESEKYNHINLETQELKDQIVFATEAGISPRSSALTSLARKDACPKKDTVFREIEGVIDRLNDDDTVRVKLFPDNYINFPSVIFSNRATVRQGQQIKYMIKTDVEGYRYQEIAPIDNSQSHPRKEMILNLLNEFKYKD